VTGREAAVFGVSALLLKTGTVGRDESLCRILNQDPAAAAGSPVLAGASGDPPRNQPKAARAYAPRAHSGPAAFQANMAKHASIGFLQSLSVLGQEGPMVCFCGPAGHRGNGPRAMARWRPRRDVECELKSYCGRRIPGHDLA
jgi:hypothetical protein